MKSRFAITILFFIIIMFIVACEKPTKPEDEKPDNKADTTSNDIF